MLTIILCIASAWIAGSIGFVIGTIMAAAKKADEDSEAFYRAQTHAFIDRFHHTHLSPERRP
jgi:hypothetical protein